MDEKTLVDMDETDADELVVKTFRRAMRLLLDKCERDAERYAKEMISPVTAEIEDDLTIAVYLCGAWGEITDITMPVEPLRDIILRACGSSGGKPHREHLDIFIAKLVALAEELKQMDMYEWR